MSIEAAKCNAGTRNAASTNIRNNILINLYETLHCRVRLKPDGTGGEVKGKLANGVGSQYSDTTSESGVSSITTVDAHTSAASSRLN
jgi:hypothetical protein